MFIGLSLSCVGLAPAKPFTPKDVSGIRLWLKADAGVLDGSSNPITVDSTAIATWQDQSGNNFHATQATAGNRPLWRSGPNGQNGLPGIAFDGTLKWLGRTEYIFTTAVSAFVVAKYANATGRYWAADIGGSGSNFVLGDPNTFGGTSQRMGFFAGDSNYSSALVHTANAELISILATTPSGGDVVSNTTLRVNQTSGAITKLFNSGLWPDYSAASGRGYAIGRAQGFTDVNMNGQVYEVIVYNRVLTTPERDAVEGYLVTKWNVV